MSARKKSPKTPAKPALSFKNDVSFKAPLIVFGIWVAVAIGLTFLCMGVGSSMDASNGQKVQLDPYNNYQPKPHTDYSAWWAGWNENWWTAGLIIFAAVFAFQGIRYWRAKRAQAKARA